MRRDVVKRRSFVALLPATVAALAGLLFAAPAPAATNLAVFNFQLKTGQDDWVWLEKFMSDQMATDLVQDRSLSVVARDRMQLMAQQMKWAPEFATTDAKVMGGIRSQLSIEYLVTGVCSIKDDQLEITAQIVEVQTRKEVHRKTVTGKTDQVIDLQKQLSADAMAWFTKRPAGEILKTLPMWTRSIPAVRALYEGMHLYDQGRYAEGWVKFRESSQEDKNYVEAVYWTGKMYYFMYRYDHARRELERFVYLNCLHPRIGDAVAEYAHTFESSAASPEDLLAMYKAFGERFPDVVLGSSEVIFVQKGAEWAAQKSINTLLRSGRYLQVARMSVPEPLRYGPSEEQARFAILSCLLHLHALTGEVLPDNVIAAVDWPLVKRFMLQFTPGQARQEYRFAEPARIYGWATESRDKEAIFCQDDCEIPMLLLAPSGYVFRSLRFDPVADGSDALMTVSLLALGCRDSIDANTLPLDQARGKGIVFPSVPRLGMLSARCDFRSRDEKALGVAVRGVNVTATLEKLGQHGAIDVRCSDTDDFRVDVDGVFGRWSTGLVGLLSPGRHTVTFRPAPEHSPYGTFTTEVNVEPGKTARVVGRLPWKDARAEASITSARLGTGRDTSERFFRKTLFALTVQADDQAIRVVRSRDGDLWSAVSTDGNSFSELRKLPLPVSTAWAEWDPRLVRDESGRFVLTFLSDRDSQHRKLVYLCWSRDFVNWSAPAQVSDHPCLGYDFKTDSAGRFICVLGRNETGEFLRSRDGYEWEFLFAGPKVDNLRYWQNFGILPRDNGRIELFTVRVLPDTKQSVSGPNDNYMLRTMPVYEQLLRFVHDGQTWSRGEVVTGYTYDERGDRVSVTNDDQGAVVLTTGDYSRGNTRIIREAGDKWESSGTVSRLINNLGAIASNSRWGYVIAHGSCVMHGLPLPEVLADASKDMPKPTIAKPNPIADGRMTEYDAEGRVVDVTIDFPIARKGARSDVNRRLSAAAPGELTYVTSGDFNHREGFKVEGAEKFTKPRPGSGTVNPDAVVASAAHNGMTIRVALDSVKPSSAYYDVLRLDLTGKGDFTNAIVVPRSRIYVSRKSGNTGICFETSGADAEVGGRIVPARVFASYTEGDTRSLAVSLGLAAEGMCLFGDKLRKVRISDDNNNLRLGDAGEHGGAKGRDRVVVYLGHELEAGNCYGQPIVVDDELYDVVISEDASKVSARKHAGPTGWLKVDQVAWKGEITGADFNLSIAAGAKPVRLPPGKYSLVWFYGFGSADAGKPRYTCRSIGGVGVEIRAGETANLAVGPPLRTGLTASVSGRTVSFKYTEVDGAGMPVCVYLPGKFVPHESRFIRIVDSQNKPINRMGIGWGDSQGEPQAQWQPRDGLSGTFTATVEGDAGPFIPKPAMATFTVK